MNTLFGKNQHPIGQFGSVHHWVSSLKGHGVTLFTFDQLVKRRCPVHGESERRFINTSATIPLILSVSLQHTVNDYFLNERDIACDIRREIYQNLSEGEVLVADPCLLPSISISLSFSCPQFLIFDYSGQQFVDLDDLNILGNLYELRSITRFLHNQSHFITYIKLGVSWYRYDGMGPRFI